MIKTMHLLLFNNSRCHTRIPLQNFNIPQFKNPGSRENLETFWRLQVAN